MDLIDNDPMSADTIEDAHDKVVAITQELQEQIDRSIKLSRTNTMTSTEFTVDASSRANKILAFDSAGEISVTQELGTYKGTDATTTTAAYVQRDIIKSTTAAQLNNVYICVADSVVGDLLTDTDHFELLVDAVAAGTSATAASSSATAAAASAAAALTSENNSATSESNAATSETNAATSATTASTAATNAATSETNAATSETNAATSETNAASSATSAASSATTATTQASAASTSATNAATSETNAATSATNAATSASNASTSETNAASSASTASTQASNAATSATNAASSATTASNAQTSVENIFDNFDDRFLGTKTSDPTVDNDGNALSVGAVYYNSSANSVRFYNGSSWDAPATSAATSATNAANSASAAATSETNAASSANTASTQANNAANSATAAQTAQTAAETALDTFDDIFLGAKSSDPSVDNDGNALQDGALYFDSTNNVLKVYDLGNTQWLRTTPTSSDQTKINTVSGISADVTSVANISADVTTTANNVSGINSFVERYRVVSSDPTTSLDAGDLAFNTSGSVLKYYDGSSWQGITAGGITDIIQDSSPQLGGNLDLNSNDVTGTGNLNITGNISLSGTVDGRDVATDGTKLDGVATSATANPNAIDNVVEDTTPQLGGNLDVQTNQIISTSNNNVKIYPNGTGVLEVGGDGSSNDGAIQLNCSQNSHGVKIQSPAHSAGQSYTLILPTSVGTNGQVLATDGTSSNQLTWIDAQETKPTVTNTSQTIAPSTATTITIAGTNFVSIPQVEFIKTDGSITVANSVTFTNSTSLSVNVTLATGNYYVRVENPDGNAGRSSSNILTASTAPSFSTAAGSLGSVAFTSAGSFTVAASSDSTVTFSKVSGTFPSGFSLNTTTGVISGTENSGGSSETTYNFTIRATDQESQTADRAFSITVTTPNYFGDGSDGSLST